MKNWKSISLLALVFFAGVGVGAITTRVAVRQAVRQAVAHPENVQSLAERNLAWKLRLDDPQRKKLREIMKAAHEKIRDLRRDFLPQQLAVTREADEKITALLTPEQRERFEKFQREERPLFPGLLPRPPLP